MKGVMPIETIWLNEAGTGETKIQKEGDKVKKKLYMVIALLIALVVTGGTFAYAATVVANTDLGTLTKVSSAFAAVTAVTDNMTWTDNVTQDTVGSVGTSELFDVARNSDFTGDMQVTVYLTNSDKLVQAYQHLNMVIDATNATPSSSLLTLANSKVTFLISGTSSDIDLNGGTWQTHISYGAGAEVGPDMWAEVTQIGID